jgi:outer membrane protein OmpA-like peptidoglycan-associated protein
MGRFIAFAALAVLAGLPLTPGARAQAPSAAEPQAEHPAGPPAAAPQTAVSPKAPDSLSVYFDTGSAAITGDAASVLDQAARLYRDGKPIIMVVSGATDTVGDPSANLMLSQRRADTVLDGLVARGIPVDRFQVVAKGETELAVPTKDNVPEQKNRRVDITWR